MSVSPELHVVCGCMFAGKSTQAIQTIRRWECIGVNVLAINNKLDSRFITDGICTHDLTHVASMSCDTLMSICTTEDYQGAAVVVVEEAHFFGDLVQFCKKAVDEDGKRVYVYGLDGNWKREPFVQVTGLCSIANHFEKIRAHCMYCKDGTEAPFTLCSQEVPASGVLVGGAEVYTAVCRHHYLEGMQP